VAPTVTAHALSSPIAEPMVASVMATFTDPESATETYTCAIDFGDGTAPVAVAVSGLMCAGPDHHYMVGGNYIVTVTVTDSGGASGSSSVTVTYLNSAPYVGPTTLFGAPSVGQTLHVSVPFLDPGSTYNGAAFETYVCKFNYGDGSGVHTGTYLLLWSASNTPGCIGPDHVYAAPGTYTITSVVTDGGGLSGSSSLIQTIAPNMSPIVTGPADQTIPGVPGAAAQISLGSFTDPGGASAGPWSVSVIWGDDPLAGWGSGGTAQTQGPISGSHAYAPGTWHLQIKVTNAAGKFGYAYANVTVLDGIAVVLAAPGQPVTEGVASTFGVFVAAFGARSLPYQVHMDWGDGTSSDLSTSYDIPPATLNHTYAAADPTTPGVSVTAYAATATVKDSQTRTASASMQVGVRDVAPVLTSAPITVPGGFDGQITLATFTDASVGPWSYAVDGGSGFQVQGQMAAPGAIQIPYNSSMGDHTFTVTVGDRGGLISTATVPVQVAAPQVGPVVVPSPLFEGQAFVASASFNALTPARCIVDFGNGTGTPYGSISGSTCSAPNYMYPAAGTYTLTFTVTDARGATGSASASVVVGNVPPVIYDLLTSGTSSVGGVVTAHANFSHPALGIDTYACTVDFGDGTSPQPGVIGDADCTADHTYSQGGLYTVTMTVTDNTGGSGNASASVPIANLRPTVGAITVSGALTENGVVHASASFTDPWSVSSHHLCSVDYGDGAGWTTWITTDQTCLDSSMHFFNDAGTFTVRLEVDRGYGEVGTGTTTVTVANVAPVVVPVYVPASEQSGVNWIPSLDFTDPGSLGAETYACTIDFGDGSGALAGVISGNVCTGPSHSYASKGSYTMEATVADSHGASGTYSAAIVVYNAAPSVGPVVAPVSAVVGSSVVASASYVPTGLSPADTCTVDYGDGSGPLAGTADGAKCTGFSHKYAAAGSFAIVVKIQATTGATASSSATIRVSSLQVGAVSVSGTRSEGSSIVASAGFTPVGSQTYKCKVDYGDGSGAQTGTIGGTTCKGPSHKYGRPGSFTITVTVTGSKGNTGASTMALDIANVMPVVTATLPSTAKIGTSVTISASFTDPGTTETYQVFVDWNDGTRVPITLGSCRSFTASHTYAKAGDYPVVVEVSDDQMAHVMTAVPVIAIYDPARSVSGSGTFASPAGACTLASRCAGASMATFSLSAAYAKGSTKPTGTFTFSAAGISFTATTFDWYMVPDGVGMLYGSGKVNGVAGYHFSVLTVDAATDKILVNIVGADGSSVYVDDYTPLKTGSIKMK
jgi:PKD repeat protein